MAGDPAHLVRQPSRSHSVSSQASSAYTQPTIDSEESDQLASSWEPAVGVVDGSGDDVLLAVQALGLMRQGSEQGTTTKQQNAQLGPDPTRSISSASHSSTSWSTSGPTSSTDASSPSRASSRVSKEGDHSQQEGEGGVVDVEDQKFIARVSALPIVSGGLEWYERSKASSRVVKYGAGLVESSLSTISRPLANNLQLGQLDDFACRQLDRLGGAGGSSPRNSPPPHDSADQTENETIDLDEDPQASRERRGRIGADEHAEGTVAPTTDESKNGQQQQAVAVASRSRWQTVLVEAGGLGAAVSEESLKSLRYCLQWLLYATAHLDHQIGILRDFITSLQRHHAGTEASDALVTASAAAHLGKIKHDVVETIRKVVDVVSKYAGAALPEQAKRYVRQSILGLPVRWASAIETGRNGGSVRGAQSGASTPVAERMNDGGEQQSTGGETPRANDVLKPTEDAAERVLTFAVESIDMLKGVTQTFSDSVSSAEAWIERLRVVGLDRQRQRQAASEGASPGAEQPLSTTAGIKRRRTPGRESDSGGEAEASSSALNPLSAAGEGAEGARRRKGPRSRDSTAASASGATPTPIPMEVE